MSEPQDSGHALADAMAALRRVAHDASGPKEASELVHAIERVETHLESWVTGLRGEVLSLQAKLEHSHQIAATDSLTGLANRHAFNERLTAMWRLSAQDGSTLGLLLLDIDHFKSFNDRDGHVAGDECLKKVAAAIKRAVDRPKDVVCRFGGDEFAVILPDTDEPGVRAIAETIRERVAQAHFTERGSRAERNVTVSIGVATVIPRVQQSPQTLISAADDALYRAKARGRNAVAFNPGREPAAGLSPISEPLRVEKARFKMEGGTLVVSPDVIEVRADGNSFTGAILEVDGGRVVQNVGRGTAVIHDAARLNREPGVGEAVCIMYHGARAQVIELLRSQHREPGRG
jgi:diguanylate cyclase (GGDEF)-like protein